MRGPCKSPCYFFKFIPPGCISQMSIPISFRKYLKSTRNNKTAILKRGCWKWPVKIDEDWMFGDGLEIFMKENGVEDFDFVVFKHEGNMVFDAMVFDISWCEREYPTHDQVAKNKAEKACPEVQSFGKCKIDTNSSKEIPKNKDLYTTRTGDKFTRCRAEAELGGPSTTSKRLKSNSEAEKHEPDFSKKKSTKPLVKGEKTAIPEHNHNSYFTGTVKAEYRLYLPTSFTTSNGLSVGKMILRSGQSQKKSWTVELKVCSRNSYHIAGGWHDFYIANGLKKGDLFQLELVKNGIKPEASFYRM